jgi:hypothetical protein
MKREQKTLSYIARLCLEYEKTPDKYTDLLSSKEYAAFVLHKHYNLVTTAEHVRISQILTRLELMETHGIKSGVMRTNNSKAGNFRVNPILAWPYTSDRVRDDLFAYCREILNLTLTPKIRPFTSKEFTKKFHLTGIYHIRIVGDPPGISYNTSLTGVCYDEKGEIRVLYFGNGMSFTLFQLAERVSFYDGQTGQWQPFGVKENSI